jgi:hypothetical protein
MRTLALALALAGCGARGGEVEEPAATVVDAPPPPPIEERVDLRPGHIWVRGRWELHGRRWRWRGGRFEPARAGFVWIGGHWQLEGDRYRWIEGRWRAAGEHR